MATHRHHRAGFVLTTATAVLLGGSLPAQAMTADDRSHRTGGISSHRLTAAQHRTAAHRAALAAEARRRATSRIAALHAAAAGQSFAAKPQLPTAATTLVGAVTTLVSTVTTPAGDIASPAAAAATELAAPVAAPVDTSPAAGPVAGPVAAAAAPAPAAPVDAAPVTAPVAAPAAPAPVLTDSPSGEAAPVGDLPGWHQTYVEDFGKAAPTGSFVSTYGAHWGAYDDGWKDTSKNGTYMPSKVLSVHNGVLDYSVHSENGQHLVSAPFVKQTFGQVYGRYSVRFRSDALAGYKTAFLLWPDSERWPDDGEIDFPEGNLDSSISGFAHNASAAGGQVEVTTGATYAQWHTATIEWAPGKVTFALDGKVMGGSTHNVPATAMHWVLQTETALDGSAPANNVAGHVLIDWVALYTRA